tara:strand:+ start:29956 stop:30876 length:921 start_codon:yes stop_codon:yes gene_type:complete
MDLIQSKEIILNEINKLFETYQIKEIDSSQKLNELNNDVTITHQMNQKLMKEIEEKDKLLLLNERKCYDYEVMINKIQDEANKELDEKTKHDMLRAKDTEIFNCTEEIKRLQKKVNELEEKLEEKLTPKKGQSDQYWLDNEMNSFHDDPEKVKLAIETYSKHVDRDDLTIMDIAKTSIGINGWYEEGKKSLVERMKDSIQKEENIEEKVEEVEEVGEVGEVEEVGEEKTGETTEEMSDVDEVSSKKSSSSSEEEEGELVSVIKHYGKEYYIIEGEDPQYIYAIEDGELGEKKGEFKNGKKHIYKNK